MIIQGQLKLMTNFARTLVLVLSVIPAVFPAPAHAQQRSTRTIHLEPDLKKRDDGTEEPYNAMEEEMRAKRAIKVAEKEYQENLDRARDLSNIAVGVVGSFKQNRALASDDLKKLEKIEKLAKGIRRAAGGSEDDTAMKKPPTDIASAVEMLGDLSRSLKSQVEKTPRRVISAVVIDDANVLLELIRIVRTLSPKV